MRAMAGYGDSGLSRQCRSLCAGGSGGIGPIHIHLEEEDTEDQDH